MNRSALPQSVELMPVPSQAASPDDWSQYDNPVDVEMEALQELAQTALSRQKAAPRRMRPWH